MSKASKKSLEKLKMECANEMGVTLNKGNNGNITSREAGSVGGRMVQKMISSYKSNY